MALVASAAFCQDAGMRRTLLLVACALAAACATTKPAGPPGSIATTGPEARFVFGEVYQGARVQAVFVIGNDAPYRITIDQVEHTCGCTSTSLTDTIIKPFESRTVVVELDTTRLWGPQNKSVILHTDDPYRRTIKLVLEGVVKGHLECDPRRIHAQITGPAYQAAVHVRNSGEQELTIVSLTVEPAEHVRAAFAGRALPVHLAPGETADLAVDAELARPGALVVGHILLQLNGEDEPVKVPFAIDRLRENGEPAQ
jgi:hypothetical protein